jgi:hypothetical protein
MPATSATSLKAKLPLNLGDVLDAGKRVMRKDYTTPVDLELRRIAGSYLERMKKFAASVSRGAAVTRSREYWLTTSRAAKIVNFLLAYPKSAPRLSWAAIKNLAQGVNWRRVSGDPVEVASKLKLEGGYRPIGNFRPVPRACQRMTRDIAWVKIGPSPFEFTCKGRGREAAILKIVHHVGHDGVRALLIADIKDFYPSITREMIYDLIDLPRAVIDSTIFIHDDTPINYNDFIISEKVVRSGLPQGAISSSLIASKIIEQLLLKIGAARAVSYGDDIVIGCGDKDGAIAHLNALASHCAEYPGGPLFLKCPVAVKIGEPMNVLGYWIRTAKRPKTAPSVWACQVTPSNKAFRRLFIRTATKLLLANADQRDWDDMLDPIFSRWSRSYSLWRGRKSGGLGISAIMFGTEVMPALMRAQDKYRGYLAQQAPLEWLRERAVELAASCVPENVLGTATTRF